MEVVSKILEWVNDPTIKTVLGIVGGLIFTRFTDLVNKTVPVVLYALSSLTVALGALFPQAAGGVTPTAFMASFSPMLASVDAQAISFFGSLGPIGSFLANAVVPIAISVGVHSSAKNTRQWWQAGAILWDASQNPSKQAARRIKK